MCKGESSGPWGIFPRVTGDRHSICRDALHSRSGFFDNQPERPLSGEEPLAERFLTVPAYLGKDRVGQIVVLNSRRDYSPTDISALARLAERYALGIQRLRFKHALKAERDFVQAILATAPALVLVLDPAGRIVGFNRACEAASGHGFAEVAGKFAWEFLSDPGEAEAQKRLFTRLLAGEAPLSYEGLWVARNGVRRRILWSSTTLKGDNNAIQNVIATGLDVTETRDAEDKLRVLTRAMESGPCSVVITDGKGILTYVNPASPI